MVEKAQREYYVTFATAARNDFALIAFESRVLAGFIVCGCGACRQQWSLGGI